MDVESISQGLVVMNINDDGYDDLLLDLGLYGQRCTIQRVSSIVQEKAMSK